MLTLVADVRKCSPSEVLKVEDKLAALDFDTACTYRRLCFENERELDRSKMLAAMFGVAVEDGDSGDDEYETITI